MRDASDGGQREPLGTAVSVSAIPAYPTWVKVTLGVVAYLVVGVVVFGVLGIHVDPRETACRCERDANLILGIAVLGWPIVLFFALLQGLFRLIGGLAS